ncbi:MAG: hypothetical protein ACAH80_03640 [Alphaproteobacteria bacterium]
MFKKISGYFTQLAAQRNGKKLMDACHDGNETLAIKLLDKGADVQYGFNEPLRQAVMKEMPGLVQTLLDRGADPLFENIDTKYKSAYSTALLEYALFDKDPQKQKSYELCLDAMEKWAHKKGVSLEGAEEKAKAYKLSRKPLTP